MRIGSLEIRSPFTRAEFAEAAPLDTLPSAVPRQVQSEIAVAESALYQWGKFPRYNPDSLIGRKGWQIYRKMARDDAAGASLDLLKCATLARGFEFDLDQNHPEAAKQEEFVEWIEAMLANCLRGTWLDKLLDVQTGHEFGFSLCEKVIEPWEYRGKTWWGLRDLKLRPFHTFRFEDDDHGNVLRVIQDARGKQIEIPLEKFVHYVPRRGIDNNFGESDLRDIYRDWWLKEICLKLWAIYQERMGGGFIEAKTKGTLNPSEKAALNSVLQNVQSRAGVKHSDKVEFTFHYPTDTESFERLIIRCDKAIARRLMNPSLLGFAEQGKTGSYSQSRTQMGAFFFVLNLRADRLADTIHEHLFRYLGRVNFGLEEVPKYKPLPMTAEEKERIASAWAEMVSKGAATNDLDTENKIREWFGLPARQESNQTGGGEGVRSSTTRPEEVDSPETVPEKGGEPVFIAASGSAAAKRVNFTEIDQKSEALTRASVETLGETMNAVWGQLKRQIVAKKLGTPDGDPAAIEALEVGKGLKAELRRHFLAGLRKVYADATKQARKELPDRSRLAEFAASEPRPGFDSTAAEDYLQARAFSATGQLTEDVLGDLRNALYNGLKYDKTTLQVMTDIKPILAPYIPELFVPGKGRALAAMLETIVRTNFFDAINEARFSFFNSEELDKFVEAMEYTAILDDRTTDICAHMDGRVYPKDSREWQGKRPPNHFNCRSLLIAVTAIDEWKESRPSSSAILPMKGFN